MSQIITLKTAPELKALLKRALPGYKKHNVFLSEFSTQHGVNINSYWDGGSKDEFVLFDMEHQTVRPLPTSTHPFFDVAGRGMANQEDNNVAVDHVGNIRLKHLPENWALIQHGWFCGKTATAHIYLNGANMTKFLTAGA